MTAIRKPITPAPIQTRTLVSRQGEVLTARYGSQKQANTAASVLERRREALVYLSKR